MFARFCALSDGFEWSYGAKIILIVVTSVILFGVAVLLVLELIGKRKLNVTSEPAEAEEEETEQEVAVAEAPEPEPEPQPEPEPEPVIIHEPVKDEEIELTEDAVLLDDGDDAETGTVVIGATQLKVRYNKSFTAKLIQSDDVLKARYSELKNELLRYGFKPRMSWSNESLYKDRVTYAKFAIRGKTLSLYLALDPEEFKDTKYFYENAGDVAKYEKVPMRLKFKSDRSVKWAKELIAILAEKNGFVRSDDEEKDFKPDYRPTSYLVIDKLIKLYYSGERVVLPDDDTYHKNKHITHKNSEEQIIDEVIATVVEEEPEVIEEPVEEEPEVVEESVEEIPEVVEEPVEEVPEVVEEPVEEVREVVEEPVEEVPEIVEEPVEEEPEVVEEPVEEVPEMVEEPVEEEPEVVEEPVEEVPEEVEEPVEEVPEEVEEPVEEEPEVIEELPVRDFEILEEINASEVEEVIGDEEAQQLIEEEVVERKKHAKPKKFYKGIVNVDSLSKHYAAGEHVTLESLHQRKLIASKTNYFKVLADGKLDKPLIVEADDFSLEAAKMILITGGRVIKKKYE